jgi:hypothetical protein
MSPSEGEAVARPARPRRATEKYPIATILAVTGRNYRYLKSMREKK